MQTLASCHLGSRVGVPSPSFACVSSVGGTRRQPCRPCGASATSTAKKTSAGSLAGSSGQGVCKSMLFNLKHDLNARMVAVRNGSMSARSMKIVTKAASPEVTTETSPLKSADPAPTTGGNNNGPQPSSLGYAALFGVALLWGSYTPALRYLFLIDEAPSPALLNALQAVLSALFLISSAAAASVAHKDANPHPEVSNPLLAEAVALAAADEQLELEGAFKGLQRPATAVEHAIAEALNWKSSSLLAAGVELGLWTFLAFGLEVAGVHLISATKAAFLNQATVLITPLLVHLSGEHVRKNEWGACGLGLLGSILVAADGMLRGATGGHGGGGAGEENVMGYVYVLVSALFFAMSTVRLGRYTNQFPSLNLASASTCGLAFFSLAWVVVEVYGRAEGIGSDLQALHTIFSDPLCLTLLLWIGFGPGALAAFLQATGQQYVPPAQAQVIYATTPLFATGFAAVALNASDEAMGPVAWGGAALMLAASLVASLPGGGPPPSVSSGSSMDSMDSDTTRNILQ
mmetsp:Transcript_14453/g.31311  ORF Transcript_14453/g.31311 Transcript_14453/m.31311 type:complete len:518 (-) Transcript_14453:1598-3151(-)